MDSLCEPVPVVLGGRQFQDLGMAPGQRPHFQPILSPALTWKWPPGQAMFSRT
jgi:hypothetical protein